MKHLHWPTRMKVAHKPTEGTNRDPYWAWARLDSEPKGASN